MEKKSTLLKKIHRSLKSLFALTSIILITISQFASAQDITSSFWMDIAESSITTRQASRVIIPISYQTKRLNMESMKDYLETVPMEYSTEALTGASFLSLPLPDGTFLTFRVVESPILAEGLANRYPDIKTYLGQGIEDPTATVRFDLTPLGFHAMIRSVNGNIFIDPFSLGDISNYIVYYSRDFEPLPGDIFVEEWDGEDQEQKTTQKPGSGDGYNAPFLISHGTQLRTYRLALAADYEYVSYFGGTKANAIAAMATTMNRVNEVYEAEVAVRMILVAGNDDLVYDVEADDPYPEDGACDLRSANQTNIDDVIGNDNYDIGHLFAIGSGGCATTNSVCNSSTKAYGVTGRPNPVGDPFDIDYVCHEMGHQFDANHTWNGNSGSCTAGQYTSTAAYEPGSATTIMGYAGICGADDLQPNSDPYFHTHSFDQIVNFITNGGDCGVITSTGNNPPSVNAGSSGYVIPISTPFQLTGSGSDPDGDAITYCWEEFDLGPQGDPGSPSGNAPIFRTFNPVTSPTRTFPKLSDLLSNTQTIGEILPTYSRDLTFRLTVRDNHAGGGGVNYDVMSMEVDDAAGPFLVTSPNTSDATWCEGESVAITWDVANTDNAPVNCTQVNILLSLDGGYTYPVTLASNTPNDGSESITLPTGNVTTTARIKVESVGNVFFDISNNNFTIKSPPIVTNQPDDLSVDWGDPASFTANATGTPTPTIQWQYSSDGVNPFTDILGETSNTLYRPCVTQANNGYQYRAVFTNDCDVVYSNTATLTVSPAITSQPIDVDAEFGDDVDFTVGYNGTPDIQWSVYTDDEPFWNPLSGEISGTLSFTCIPLDMDGNKYRATLTTGCETVNTDEATLTVVPKVTTSTIAVTPNSQQYSDLVDIEVTLNPGEVCGESPATGAHIYVGTQKVGEVTFTLIGDDLKGYLYDIALLEPTPFGTAPTGQMAPGDHTVTAYLQNTNPNFNVSDPTTTLTIQPEDATADYTGALYASTQGVNSSEAIVTLSATIKDITAEDPILDPNAGNIRNATLTFINRDDGTIIKADVPIGLVDPNDPTVAVGTFDWNVTISGDAEMFTIGVVVGGYYDRDLTADDAIVVVAKPLPNFVTGGGYITLANPAGMVAGDVGSKNNFGFNVKFNKKGTNLQGKVNSIIRRTEADGIHTYQIKGNKMNSLAVLPDDFGGEATINCKANIQDITDPSNPVSVEGNASMQINMTDKGEPGVEDIIAITIWDKWGGLWFSSNWDGTSTIQQLLDGGNLAVHSNASFKATLEVDNIAESDNALRIAPNPNNGEFSLMFEPQLLPQSLIMVVDMRGKIIRKHLLTNNQLQIDLKGPGKGIYQVIIFNGNDVYKTKVIVN